MILSEIRYLVGVHLGQKGLPPTVIAPINNILSLLDEELTVTGFTMSTTIEKEVERLKNAIILMNYNEEDEEDNDDPIVIDDDEDEEFEDDDDDDNLFLDDEDEDDS